MSKKTGLLFVLFTALVSGFSIFINKFGIAESNPYIFTFGKNLIVSMILFSVILFFNELASFKELNTKQWLKLAAIGFFGGSIPFLLFFKGLSLTSAAMASFIHKTMFIYVAIFAGIFLKEKINKGILTGGILLLAGNLLLLKVNSFSFNIGDLLVLIAALFWAVEFTISKNALNDIRPNLVAFGRMAFGSFFILLFLITTGNISDLAAITFPQIAWACLASVFLFFYVFTWYNGLKHIDVSVAACILLLGSPVTTLLSFIFLGTGVTIMQAIGMILIVAGVGFAVSYSFLNIKKFFQPHTSNE